MAASKKVEGVIKNSRKLKFGFMILVLFGCVGLGAVNLFSAEPEPSLVGYWNFEGQVIWARGIPRENIKAFIEVAKEFN